MSTLILQILQINAKSIPDVKVILNIFLYDLLIVFVILAKYIHQHLTCIQKKMDIFYFYFTYICTSFLGPNAILKLSVVVFCSTF